MFTLTERRFTKLLPMLESYSSQLHSHKQFDTGSFEREVRELLDTGYREVKDIARGLLKRSEFRLVGLYYMQNESWSEPNSDFWGDLAKAYGVRSYDNSPERPEKQREFWERELGAATAKVRRKPQRAAQ
ncbi:MAG: hypothetical protein AABP62_11500 [Planctomycetota bacterium]